MSMIPDPEAPRVKTTIMLLWIIWASSLGFLGILCLVLGHGAASPAGNPAVNLVGFVPLFVSIVIRWLVLPRSGAQPGALLVMVVIGTALAETCGILGLLLGGPYRQDLFILGMLGVAQFVPIFARRAMEPKPQGFIPNN
jgi:hypothetical protein